MVTEAPWVKLLPRARELAYAMHIALMQETKGEPAVPLSLAILLGSVLKGVAVGEEGSVERAQHIEKLLSQFTHVTRELLESGYVRQVMK